MRRRKREVFRSVLISVCISLSLTQIRLPGGLSCMSQSLKNLSGDMWSIRRLNFTSEKVKIDRRDV